MADISAPLEQEGTKAVLKNWLKKLGDPVRAGEPVAMPELVAAGLIAGGLLFAQYWFSDRIALYAMRGRIVTPEQAPELHGVIDRLCALADMPKPAVAIAAGVSRCV